MLDFASIDFEHGKKMYALLADEIKFASEGQ